MPSPLQFTSLIYRLKQKISTFADKERLLDTEEKRNLDRATSLIAAEPSWNRNHNKNKGHTILNNIQDSISHEFFFLCAISVPPSVLGNSSLGDDDLSSLSRWWAGASHPSGLKKTSVGELKASRERVSISHSIRATQPCRDLEKGVYSKLKDPNAGKITPCRFRTRIPVRTS